jgi:hypothetical protein
VQKVAFDVFYEVASKWLEKRQLNAVLLKKKVHTIDRKL